MQFEPNEVQLDIPESIIPTIAASKRLYSEAGDNNQSTASNESSIDLDFFQTCPLGYEFELDCWKGQMTDLVGTGAMSTNNQSEDDPGDFDWSGSSSSLEDE